MQCVKGSGQAGGAPLLSACSLDEGKLSAV